MKGQKGADVSPPVIANVRANPGAIDRRAISAWIKGADNWLLLGVGVLASVFFAQTFNYKPSAALFPRVVSVVVAALCLYQLGSNVWEKRISNGASAAASSASGLAWHWTFLSLLAYVGLIALIGFLWATALYLLGFPILMGYRRWRVLLIVTVVMTLLVEFSFNRFLHIPLPEGMIQSLMGR